MEALRHWTSYLASCLLLPKLPLHEFDSSLDCPNLFRVGQAFRDESVTTATPTTSDTTDAVSVGTTAMASFLLLVLFTVTVYMVVALLSVASSSQTGGGETSGGAHAFSPFALRRLRRKRSAETPTTASTTPPRRKQRSLFGKTTVRGDSNHNNSNNSESKWWEDLTPNSPFRLLLPEEEDELFFADADESHNSSTGGVVVAGTSRESRSADGWQASAAGSSERCDAATAAADTTTNGTGGGGGGGVSHFCFLVHGHRGHSRDLSYVQAVLRRRWRQTTTAAAASKASSSLSALPPPPAARLIVHSCTCNEKKTDDGVAAGGERLVDEMLAFIRSALPPPRPASVAAAATATTNGGAAAAALTDVTLSIWGNSLGGLYARYALSALSARCRQSCRLPHDDADSGRYYVLDDAYAVHLNIFCTTATPHLGVSGHTFVALPRRAEIGVARAMGETGRDLFRLNALLHTMAVDEAFLRPLAAFRKRICYANAYGTDFPVPASTAAFLSASSTYPHHFGGAASQLTRPPDATAAATSADGDENNNTNAKPKSLVIAVLHTPAAHESERAQGCYDKNSAARSSHSSSREESGASDDVDRDPSAAVATDAAATDTDAELEQMSISLDALGWKKVFIDMRKEVPRISIPLSLLRRSGSNLVKGYNVLTSHSDASSSDEETITILNETMALQQQQLQQQAIEPIHRLKGKGVVVCSKEVAAAVSTTALLDDGDVALHWPIGHNMIVAFSRSRWSTYMNKAGRPVVDELVTELVDDIFAFRPPHRQPGAVIDGIHTPG